MIGSWLRDWPGGRLAALVAARRRARLGERALRRLRERRLREVVEGAWANVPFYRDAFAAAGFRAGDIRSLADLSRLPLTTKTALRDAGEEATLARGHDRATGVVLATSGTTGEPLRVHRSPHELRAWQAVELRCLLGAGFRPRDRLLVVGPLRGFTGSWAQRLGVFRTEVVLGTLPVDRQLERLLAARPDLLWGYPNDLIPLLEAGGDALRSHVRPRAVITSAHVTSPELRARLTDVFGAPVFDFYGAMEVGRIAAECGAHCGLHVMADNVIVECLVGDRPARPGEIGQVVVTSLVNHTMPFVRYVLGDAITVLPGPCPCGSTWPRLTAPVGRPIQLFRLPSGRLRNAHHVQSVLRDLPWLNRFTYEQDASGQVCVAAWPRGELPADAEATIRGRVVEMLGEPLEVLVRLAPPSDRPS